MDSKDTEPLKIDFVIDFDVFNSAEYKRHFAFIGRNPLGHTINQRVVYTPQLAFILSQPLTGFDRVLNKRIDGKANVEFSKLYFKGYDKGFEYFKAEYLQTDVYLMPQLDFWVKKIDRLYNHDGVYRFGGVANGWNFVKKKYPLIITNEVLHEYGFYSGLCASAEKFNHENKEIFEAYELKAKSNENSKGVIDKTDTTKGFEPEMTQKNFFNPDTKLERVREHFNELIECGYLSKKNFEKFIELAFIKMEKPSELIELEFMPIPKQKFVKYFVQYYQDVSGKPKGKANDFLLLCKDYFKGFEKLSVSNWTK